MDHIWLYQKVLGGGEPVGTRLRVCMLVVFLIGVSAVEAQQPAAPFTGVTLAGDSLVFEPQQIERPVLIVFWASWCRECRYEFHELKKLETATRGRLDILGVSVDRDIGKAVAMAQKAGLPYPSVFDPDASISALYAVRATPTIVLIDRQGRVRHSGHRLDQSLRGVLDELLH